MKTILDTLKQVQANLEAAGTFGNEASILARVRRDLASIMHIDPDAWLDPPAVTQEAPPALDSEGEVPALDSEGEVPAPASEGE